jgi:hypothetical protein
VKPGEDIGPALCRQKNAPAKRTYGCNSGEAGT